MLARICLKISQFFLGLAIFLMPLFFLPFTNNFFDFPKVNLFLAATVMSGFFWFLSFVSSGKFALKNNRYFYPLSLIFLAHLLSFAINFKQIDKFQAFWQSLPFSFFPFFLILLTNLFEKPKKLVKTFWLIDGAILSALSIWLFLTPNSAYPLNLSLFGFPLVIPNSAVSTTGTIITLVIFILSLLPLAAENFISFFNEDLKPKKNFWLKVLLEALLVLTVLTGLGIMVFQIYSQNIFSNLPAQIGWSIAVETLKNPIKALFGVGPNQFFSAFTQFKPISINLTPYWTVGFNYSSNEFFQILTTLGLVGLATYLFLISRFIKAATKKVVSVSIWVILVSLILTPGNFFIYFILVVYLALDSAEETTKNKENVFPLNQKLGLSLAAFALILTAACFYFLGRNLLAEFYYQRSLISAQQGQAAKTYNLLNQAINLNPYKSNFHQSSSQTNFVLANTLVANSSPTGLSDQDKSAIAQLIQQALREAKNDVSLAPQNAQSWENLASLYRQLLNFAQGADQWAAASYNQVLKLDPNNPQAYLNFGGFYYSLAQYDQAISLFQAAVTLKPNFANAYYNLAAGFKMEKEYPKAYEALIQTNRYLPFDSPDYQKVQKEIEEIKTHLVKSEKPAQGETTLSLPEPLPTPQSMITPLVLPKPEEATSSNQ